MSLWGGRFDGGLDEYAWELNTSLPVDKTMAAEDVDGSLVWAKGLLKAGIIKPEEHKVIDKGLNVIKHELLTNTFRFDPMDEDIHSAVERRLTEMIGAVARKLHTGRSRNDQVATDFRLWLLRHIPTLLEDLDAFQSVLVQNAEKVGDMMMPGYTHLQRAQPILVAHWWMSTFWPLERDKDRLKDLLDRVAVLPLGSGALAGNPIGVDREYLAKELGFSSVSQNSLDAVSDRDFAAEFLFCASMIGIHLSKLSEQMVLFTSSEFNFFTLPDEYSTGSSLMPQKKNPDLFELSRGKAGTLIGTLTGFIATLKGLPSTYDKDLQEDKAPVFSAHRSLHLVLQVLAAAVSATKPNSEKMASAIDSFMMATDLADHLVAKGIPFRDTHELSGKAVKMAIQKCVGLDKLTMSDYLSIDPRFDQDLYKWLDPRNSIERRNSIGGTSSQAVQAQIEKAKLLLIKGDK